MSERDSDGTGVRAAAEEAAVALAAAAEAAVSDLEQRLPTGFGPAERVLAGRIRAAARRLLECAEQLASDQLMVPGSTGQRRAHPLLKEERDLRREISDGLEKLTFRAENRALCERLNASHQRRRGKREDGTA